jgi:hypothetical protein
MRKGYGPTGVSFTYTFTDFRDDLALFRETGDDLWVEVVVGGNTYTTRFNPDMSESEARSLYDGLDHVAIVEGYKRYQLQARV